MELGSELEFGGMGCFHAFQCFLEGALAEVILLLLH